ncbi:TRAP transporter small permease [Salibacterium salarium]|uniref:TRAP transporter small permease n=1 Tax=Salibacterium salarium TaxID=284579 RepID=A0A3R9QKZ9_9BACI|nr:TRAP transporter small permease [Salibacterium salarium]RSL33112.1 TRAP transporter small permease [Salibacterium salarium]
MGHFLNLVEKIIDTISNVLHYISNVVLCLMMLIISFDVIGRSFFGQPITGSFELTELSSALLVFFSFAIAHKYKEHIAIGFVVDKLPEKVRHFVEGAIEVLIFFVIIIMSWQIYNDAVRVMGRNAVTSDLSLPVYPFIILICVGSVAFALLALSNSFKHFARVVDKK